MLISPHYGDPKLKKMPRSPLIPPGGGGGVYYRELEFCSLWGPLEDTGDVAILIPSCQGETKKEQVV